jgi:hypothetical protein
MKRASLLLFLLALVAGAQLTDECVATAAGRRVTLDADGGFTLHNLPEGNHLIRVYVTCHRVNGSVDYARSELIEVIAGQRVTVSEWESASTPFPSIASLRLRSTTSIITSIGGLARITSVATLSNGAQINANTRDIGTTYHSSNPAIATVDANGFVTARSVGQVIISASNDGVVGSIAINILLSLPSTDIVGRVANSANARLRVLGQAAEFAAAPDGSFRQNGLPSGNPLSLIAWDITATGPRFARRDDIAPVSNGLTDAGILSLGPASAEDIQAILDGDGAGDGDSDGLSDLGEFLAGTNPTIADSDGDGTLDGQEDPDGDTLTNAQEIALGSNPLLLDSDGDGFSDIDEHLLGTLLTDPNSRPKHSARALPLSYHNSRFPSTGHRAQALPVSILNLEQSGQPRAPVSPPVRYDNGD